MFTSAHAITATGKQATRLATRQEPSSTGATWFSVYPEALSGSLDLILHIFVSALAFPIVSAAPGLACAFLISRIAVTFLTTPPW